MPKIHRPSEILLLSSLSNEHRESQFHHHAQQHDCIAPNSHTSSHINTSLYKYNFAQHNRIKAKYVLAIIIYRKLSRLSRGLFHNTFIITTIVQTQLQLKRNALIGQLWGAREKIVLRTSTADQPPHFPQFLVSGFLRIRTPHEFGFFFPNINPRHWL